MAVTTWGGRLLIGNQGDMEEESHLRVEVYRGDLTLRGLQHYILSTHHHHNNNVVLYVIVRHLFMTESLVLL